jgi:hypothetical protein
MTTDVFTEKTLEMPIRTLRLNRGVSSGQGHSGASPLHLELYPGSVMVGAYLWLQLEHRKDCYDERVPLVRVGSEAWDAEVHNVTRPLKVSKVTVWTAPVDGRCILAAPIDYRDVQVRDSYFVQLTITKTP